MKNKATLLAIAVTAALTITHAETLPVAISPLEFKLNAYLQNPAEVTSTKVKESSTSTNTTVKTKTTITRASVQNENLLVLLANSFNTNFPADSVISGVSGSVFVADATGTNVILNVSDVMHFSPGESFWSGSETVEQTTDDTGVHYSNTSSYSGTGTAKLIYDDSALTTADGTHTVFYVNGLLTSKSSYKKEIYKNSFTLNGQGDGKIQNTTVILEGMIQGTGPGPVKNEIIDF